MQTYVITTHPKKVVWARLKDNVVTDAFAKQKEKELTDLLQTDVIVTTRNVEFFQFEELSPQEVAALLPKGTSHVAQITKQA